MVSKKAVAQVLIDTLAELGVKRAYGIPGDSINPLVEALRRNPGVQLVHVTREDSASIASSFEAKFTQEASLCFGAAGPGAVLLLNGLYDAKMDHAPVIAITGQIESAFLGLEYSKEVNTNKLFDDVALYNVQLTNPNSAKHLVMKAYREAILGKGVSHISAPVDILKMEVEEDVSSITPKPVEPSYVINPESAERLINESERPLILVGRGCYGAGERISKFAEAIGAPIVYSLFGKGVLDDFDHKVMGGIGILGTEPSFEALNRTDLLIVLGSSFPHYWYFPSDLKVLQVDANPSNLGKRYRVTAGYVCDVKAFLESVRPKNKERKFYEELKPIKQKWREKMKEKEDSNAKPIKPQRVMRELSLHTTKDTPIVVDVGSLLVWAARNFYAKTGQRVLFSAWYGSMGVAVPAAIGVSLASSSDTLAIVGDGGMNMSALELTTAKRYGAAIKVVVFNNEKLSMIKFEQEMAGYPEYATKLLNPDYVTLSESMGVKAMRVEEPKELSDSIRQFFELKGVALLDVRVDGDESPLFAEFTRIE